MPSRPTVCDPNALFDAVQYPGAPAGDVDLYIKTVFPHAFAADLPAATAAHVPPRNDRSRSVP